MSDMNKQEFSSIYRREEYLPFPSLMATLITVKLRIPTGASGQAEAVGRTQPSVIRIAARVFENPVYVCILRTPKPQVSQLQHLLSFETSPV